MVFRFLSSGSLLCGLLFALAPSTHAAEQLRVPFACDVTPSGVRVFPSRDQSYRIIGRRDAAPFTACASDNPNRCRTMMLHRFEIDCNGVPISWPEFYAAISEVTTGGRAHFEGNRLLVRVRPQRQRNQRRSRFDPPPSQRSFVVEMPDGYAPVRGTVARFDGPRNARRQPMRPTRDPFSSSQPEADANIAPEIARPIPAAKPKPTVNRTIVTVPTNSKADTPPALKAEPSKTIEGAPTPPPRKRIAIKTVPETVNAKLKPSQAETKTTETKPIPQPKAERAPFKAIDVEKSIQKAENSATKSRTSEPTPAVIPKLLNGSKTALKQIAVAKDASKKPVPPAEQGAKSKSMEDLLQDRAAQTNTGLLQDSKTTTQSAPANTKDQTPTNTTDAATSAEAPGPSLANTVAVLGVVASLLLALSAFAYRLLTPKQNNSQFKTHKTPTRPDGAPETSDTARLAGSQQPDFASLTASPQPPPKTEAPVSTNVETPSPKREPNLFAASDQKTSDPVVKTALAVPVDRAPQTLKAKKAAPDLDHQGFIPTLDATQGISKMTSGTVTKPEPELPMPDIIAAKLKQPDFDESALLVPKTRQEALTALGIGESANAEVIEKVVTGLRQTWRPDDARDNQERMRRQQRMEQIETAWQILSQTMKDDAPANAIGERAH